MAKRKRPSKTGIVKDKQGKWRWAAGTGDKAGEYAPDPRTYAAEQRRRDKKGNITQGSPPINFERSGLTGKRDVGKSQGASKRKKERAKRKPKPAKKPKKKTKRPVKSPSKPSDGAYANDIAEYLLLEYAIDVAKFGWRTMRALAPEESGALKDSIDFEVKKNKLIKGYTAEVFVGEEIYYADWVTEGTGIYGPEGKKITPVTANYLRFEWKKKGNILVIAKSVKGQQPNPFADAAYRVTLEYSRQKDKELANKLGLIFSSNIS